MTYAWDSLAVIGAIVAAIWLLVGFYMVGSVVQDWLVNRRE